VPRIVCRYPAVPKVRFTADRAAILFQSHIHQRPKTECQNLSPYRAAASPQPAATARSIATNAPPTVQKIEPNAYPRESPEQKAADEPHPELQPVGFWRSILPHSKRRRRCRMGAPQFLLRQRSFSRVVSQWRAFDRGIRFVDGLGHLGRFRVLRTPTWHQIRVPSLQ
jgi:hypothetical protein